MSSRTTTVRPTRTTTKSQDSTTSQQQQQQTEPPSTQDRCAHCKKFLSAVKAECRHCRLVFCMEHRHPETHSQTCAQKGRDQARQQFQRDSGHILGAEARDRGVTHRQPGWNIETSRQELHQRLQQRVQSLQETTGRSAATPSSTSTTGGAVGGGGGGGTGGKKAKGSNKKKPAQKTWGTGGSRLGGVPGSGTPGGGPAGSS
ncbi:hypothetical protein BGZ89_012079 [Linnemannia elongata]|uniref:Uncharacterized protein n=1 Tax=Linnemannia elongata AG-77 TaxID=1314771 RepID=A0A197KEW9_9FUNG|nr:hypothetical protein BGZ89_012079 [Linnemannia elongata]KAK5799391.1 hypothetical protein F5H01DRAFT_357355 [Linnemannia elongata]OAQ35708.1 hypothetical protein K457DRAFT_132402 [Linnemannia elongata AG-77]